jgi:hypothetical protein
MWTGCRAGAGGHTTLNGLPGVWQDVVLDGSTAVAGAFQVVVQSAGIATVALDIERVSVVAGKPGSNTATTTTSSPTLMRQYTGFDSLWSYHDVVVKDGLVFDAFGPATGVTIADWIRLWNTSSVAINFSDYDDDNRRRK